MKEIHVCQQKEVIRLHRNNRYSRRERKKKTRRIWLWVLMLVVFLTAVAAGAFFASSSLFDLPRSGRIPRLDNDTLLVATDKTTVMIMGVDERADDVGRSDTLMLATIDPKRKQASLLSIPRDTRVLIRGSYDKINSAYAYGGWKLTRDTVEDLLDTPVDHYVLINTRSFPRIIDAIGGVDIYVDSRMYYVDEWDDATPGGLVIDLYPGMQHMDGVTAMSYVRYRDEDGDIGRIARQQKFMQAVMDKIASPAIITQLPSVVREGLSAVETDLSFRQLLELAGSLKEAQANGLHAEMLAGRPLYIDDISYWIPDLKETRTRLAATLGITMSPKARSEMEREQREYEASIPGTAREVPDDDTSIGRLPRRTNQSSLPVTRPSGAGNSSAGSTSSSRRSSDAASSRDTDTSSRRDADSEASSSSIQPSWAETESDAPRPGDTDSRTFPGGTTDSEDRETSSVSPPDAPEPPARPTAPSSPTAPSMTSSGKGR